MSFESLADEAPLGRRPRYAVDRRRRSAVRRVPTEQGDERTSVVRLADDLPQDVTPRGAFDLSWLRSSSKPPSSASTDVTIVDLFAGCGGLSLGAAEACRALELRPRHLMAVETNDFANAVFSANFDVEHLVRRPVEQLVDGVVGESLSATERRLRNLVGNVDLLLAGPPCQGHSDLNNHTRRADPKNALYMRAVRFVEVTQPSVVLIENVPGAAHDRTAVVQRAHAALAAMGYHIATGVVRADEFGVAQARRRHVTIATRVSGFSLDDLIGSKTASRPVMWAISDLGVVPGDVFNTPANHSSENRRRMKFLLEHELFELPDSERPDCHRLKPHSYRSVYGRMRPDQPAPTITSGFGSTGQGRFVHPLAARTLTPHEAARVQGFPDFFDFSACEGRRGLQELIGNAVPPGLAYALVMSVLRKTEQR